MQYNDVEMKLIRLALDKAAHDGEFANAAAALIRQLRKRGVTPEQMFLSSNSSMGNYESLWRMAQSNADHYRRANNDLMAEVNRLKALLSQARQPSGTATEPPKPKQRRPRTAKYGIRELSEIQRALLFKIARRVGDDLSRPIRKCYDTHAEAGTLQGLLKKGMVEKMHRRGWHKLTEKGIEYWRKYGSSSSF